jgi:hypothetical protein
MTMTTFIRSLCLGATVGTTVMGISYLRDYNKLTTLIKSCPETLIIAEVFQKILSGKLQFQLDFCNTKNLDCEELFLGRILTLGAAGISLVAATVFAYQTIKPFTQKKPSQVEAILINHSLSTFSAPIMARRIVAQGRPA